MPCTISKEEEEYYQKEDNKKEFGQALTNAKLLEEVACQATNFLYDNKLLDEAPPLVKKWFVAHAAKDKKAGRR